MTLTDMRTNVRRDLHDEDAANYRWTDDELDRHIARGLKEFSEAIPLEQKATLATTASSREILHHQLNQPDHGRDSRIPGGAIPQTIPAVCFLE